MDGVRRFGDGAAYAGPIGLAIGNCMGIMRV